VVNGDGFEHWEQRGPSPVAASTSYIPGACYWSEPWFLEKDYVEVSCMRRCNVEGYVGNVIRACCVEAVYINELGLGVQIH
jgi:hypothetical protein